MRNRTIVGIALLVFAQGTSGCGDNDYSSTPLGPAGAPQASPPPRPPVHWPADYTLTAVSLAGVVYESTATGRVPIPGMIVYCELCGTETHTSATTDADGFYLFPGDLATGGGVWLSSQPTPILLYDVEKKGYRDPAGLQPLPFGCPSGFSCREVLIKGDTRLDIELVRR